MALSLASYTTLDIKHFCASVSPFIQLQGCCENKLVNTYKVLGAAPSKYTCSINTSYYYLPLLLYARKKKIIKENLVMSDTKESSIILT